MDARRKRDVRLCALAIALMGALAFVHLAAPEVTWIRRLELAAFDAQMRWRGARPPGPETALVMIDDRTIAELGQWPVPRAKFAELVTRLRVAGAKVVGIDVLFADPDSASDRAEGDATLARAIREAGNVVLPFTFDFAERAVQPIERYVARAAYARLRNPGGFRPLALEPTAVVTPIAPLADAATLGHTLLAYDVDGSPRYEYPALAYDLDYFPSMALRIVQRYLDVPWQDVVLSLGEGVAVGPLDVATDAQMRVLVDYLGPSGAFPGHSFSQVLRGEVPDEAFRGRIVLVGANALGTRDTFKSPFTAVLPGVERLATAVDAMLHGRQLRRPPVAPWIEVASMLLAAIAIALSVSRLSLAAAAIVTVALAATFVASAQIALARFGVWQASAVPAAALVMTFIPLSLYRYGLLDRERRRVRAAFRRYLSPQMVDRLVDDERPLELGGELRELSILFCDLQGFTALSERLGPADLTRVVNQFLGAATDAVLDYGGTVDKYVGDCIMAFWNAPVAQANHAELACRAALRIVDNIARLNDQWQREGTGLPHLRAGVGINTGACTVGNFGSSHRFDYSAIGDAVNVAARLESETRTRAFPILLGPQTAAGVPRFATLPLGSIRLKGRREALDVHALVGDERMREQASFRVLRENHTHSPLAADESRESADGLASRRVP